jgi:hypothetical protein
MDNTRVYAMSIAKVYPFYVAKAQKKGRSQAEVDQVIRWLTGYTPKGLQAQLAKEASLKDFFSKAPKPNPARKLVKGVVCGVRVEDVKEPLMREIRRLDKLVDELAKGKAMGDVLRGELQAPTKKAKR